MKNKSTFKNEVFQSIKGLNARVTLIENFLHEITATPPSEPEDHPESPGEPSQESLSEDNSLPQATDNPETSDKE